MIGIVYDKRFYVAAAYPQQCAYTWYRLDDQTVILVFVGLR